MHQMKLWYLIIQYCEFCLIKEINFGLQQLKSSLAVCTKKKTKTKKLLTNKKLEGTTSHRMLYQKNITKLWKNSGR